MRAERPGLPVLVLSELREAEVGPLALRMGAAGFVPRHHAARQLAEAVRVVAEGGRYVSPRLGAVLAEALSAGQTFDTLGVIGGLSAREVQVVRLLAQGLRRREIAAHMAVAAATVTTYRRRALAKLGLRSTVDLTRFALRHGLVSDEPLDQEDLF